jgi:ABC-2 type transport system permease protein
MKSLRIATHGGVLTFRALFNFLSPMVFFTVMLLTPLLQIIFFASFGPAFSDLQPSFFAAGNALQVAAMAAVFGVSQTIANERFAGSINNVLMTPASRVALYAGRGLPHLAIGALTAAVGLVLAASITDLHLTSAQWASVLPVIVVTTASCTGVGMLFGALGLMGRDTTFSGNIAYIGLLLLSGAAVPPSYLPAPLAIAAHGLPMTNGVAALRKLLVEGAGSGFWSLIAWEAVVGAVWIALTLAMLHRIERRARRSGRLDFV